ncbi:MAG: hypothetical protein P1U61_00975 [Legionellaceae bacterium]|nr:hypothetical protein [Legionellaceae bacterium]
MPFSPKTAVYVPDHLSESLSTLKTRWGMAPNQLSHFLGSYLMQPILPALRTNTVGHKTYHEQDYKSRGLYHVDKNTYQITNIHGAQTLTVTVPDAKQHIVYFGRNSQDSLSPYFVQEVLKEKPNTNYIFQNYPGVGTGQSITHITPLFQAGYEAVKTLLDSDVPAKDITLKGLSLGGGVAAHVAKKLHDEGHSVNLVVDRSFASLSALPANLETRIALGCEKVSGLNEAYEKYGCYLPLVTSITACTTLGASIGTALAGLITGIGVLLANLIANTGYYLSLALAFTPGLSHAASTVNVMFNTIAEYTDMCFDVIGSILGSLVGITTLLTGAVVGAAVGGLLSLQLYWTDKPVNMPLGLAASALLNTTVGEMDSARKVKQILNSKNHGHVTIINAKDDDVIISEDSLNTGIGLSDNPDRVIKKQGLGGNLSSFWFKHGGHGGDLYSYNMDSELTHDEPAPAL